VKSAAWLIGTTQGKKMHLLIGTSGFAYREWRGKFYPRELPPREMLRFYAGRFRAVEINATFYRMPSVSVLEGWAAEVPEEFVFSFKAPAVITHRKRLRNAAAETAEFAGIVSVLGPRLGPLLFQLPPTLPRDISLLGDFLSRLPLLKTVFEFRHASWFEDRVFDLLRQHGCALCVSDREGEPPPPIIATTGFGYARLRRSTYSDEELREWRDQLGRQGWDEAYVFFRHEENANGPVLAERLTAAHLTPAATAIGIKEDQI
jgi:uncharacterized protein YecE (DUF72 family)